MDFIEALKVAEGVMDQYRADFPKWWKRMDGTPILNDLPVRMATAFVEREHSEVGAGDTATESKCTCGTASGPDYCVEHAA